MQDPSNILPEFITLKNNKAIDVSPTLQKGIYQIVLIGTADYLSAKAYINIVIEGNIEGPKF